ncbi:MAG: hypothetical protein M1838_002965 [Thelocarpon superellum]|nr:MAG: hypothetical protein M1838_002965 [Thelocarpon superellum]
MPHAQSNISSGFQALILCGPGVSLNTFTSNQDVSPKALLPVANRPMVWYPLEWCYRMGISQIHLVTPPISAAALEAALATNPHLTSLPHPKPDVLAPADLSQNTGTAALLRLPEVQAVITGDFIVLPCDVLCELSGESLLEAWMIQHAALGAAPRALTHGQPSNPLGGERTGRRGGLGVWYDTKGIENVKTPETDFIMTAPWARDLPPTASGALLPHIANLVYTVPTDTLKDITEQQKSLPIRHALIRTHAAVKMRTTYRDAHIYFFPYWTLEMIRRNEIFDSISEDVIGWWAKAGWQEGLADKLGLRPLFQRVSHPDGEEVVQGSEQPKAEIDLGSMSTTWTSTVNAQHGAGEKDRTASTKLASRTHRVDAPAARAPDEAQRGGRAVIPPMLAYVQPSLPTRPMIRRCDTTPLLLALSLQLAKLSALDADDATTHHPHAHKAKIADRSGVAARSTVTTADCLLGENVMVEEKCVIKESVLGAGCKVESGARLTRCLLMDGVVVGEKAQLSGCVLGTRCAVGKEAVLRDCEVQEAYAVPEKSDAKNEKFMMFEGLEDDEPEEAVGDVSDS